jgi:hypothetical protein
MKPLQNLLLKMRVAGLSASLLCLMAGCAGSGLPLGAIGDLFGVRVTTDQRNEYRSEYIYYPQYDLYYNRNRNEFLSVENGRWVSREYPRNVSAQQVLRSRSVSIDNYDSPGHHRAELARQDSRYAHPTNDWEWQDAGRRYDRNRTYRRY